MEPTQHGWQDWSTIPSTIPSTVPADTTPITTIFRGDFRRYAQPGPADPTPPGADVPELIGGLPMTAIPLHDMLRIEDDPARDGQQQVIEDDAGDGQQQS